MIFFDDKILANPALGKTGNNLQKYFTHNNLNNLIEKSIHDLHKYKKYKVILMNSIQYQCSLGCNPKNIEIIIGFSTGFLKEKKNF